MTSSLQLALEAGKQQQPTPTTTRAKPNIATGISSTTASAASSVSSSGLLQPKVHVQRGTSIHEGTSREGGSSSSSSYGDESSSANPPIPPQNTRQNNNAQYVYSSNPPQYNAPRTTASSTTTSSSSDFGCLKTAIKVVTTEACKAEELYKAESQLLSKANAQLAKFSHLLQEQDAELANTEDHLNKERKQREAAEKHFIRLKKMMVVKDVEVSEALHQQKAEQGLRKGAEREMALLRRQLQAKDTQLTTLDRKHQKECKKREQFELQMIQLSKQAGKQSAEEQYQILQRIRNDDEKVAGVDDCKENACGAANAVTSPRGHNRHHHHDAQHVNSLVQQITDMQAQVNSTTEDLTQANARFQREQQLREEADKQLIVMREKGFAHHVNKRTSAQTHAKDCLNTERLKLKHADLVVQYDTLKMEAKTSLEKARDKGKAEMVARERMERHVEVNRKEFDDALEKERSKHQSKMEEVLEQLNTAKMDMERAKASTDESSQELQELREKHANFQQQVIDAKADSKKEFTLRLEMTAEMKLMEQELDSMETELKDLKVKDKELGDLRLVVADDHTTQSADVLELREKVTMLEDEIKALEARSKLLKEKYHKEQALRETAEDEISKLEQNIQQITTALDTSNHQQQISEERCETLRQRVQAITANFQKTLAQGENSEQNEQLKLQALTLNAEVEATKGNCISLRESLEKSQHKNRQLQDEVLAGAKEPEKLRKEKRLREVAEEQCRSFREEIVRLKQEQVMSGQKHPSIAEDEAADLEERIACLEEDLNIAETRQKMSQEQHEEEKRRREDIEKQNMAFRELLPEYAEAEERYQKERRLRSDAQSTVDELRQKIRTDKFWSEKDGQTKKQDQQQVLTLKGQLTEVRSQYVESQATLKGELTEVRSQYIQSQGELHKSQKELQVLRTKSTLARASASGGNPQVEKKLREKAEKQVMSMRLKVEAKESQIASLKSRLSDQHSVSSESRDSRDRRRLSDVEGEVRSPPAPTRQLEYRASGMMKTSIIPVHHEPRQQPHHHHHHQQEHHFRQQILMSLPDYVKSNFGRIGFVKHSAYDHWPALVLDPFTVPLSIQQKWMELYYEFDKRDMYLVYLYGRRHSESVNAYPIVEPHHFVSYQEGVERSLDQLPSAINVKLQYGDELTEIEEELNNGLSQIRLDLHRTPGDRTHPLDERRRRNRTDEDGGVMSMTSSTSYATSLGLDSFGPEENVYGPEQDVSPTKRPRSEYSLPQTSAS